MKRGIVVSPGAETTIDVSELHRVRLPQPWGNCAPEQKWKPPKGYNHESVRYTFHSCYDICSQAEVIYTFNLKKIMLHNVIVVVLRNEFENRPVRLLYRLAYTTMHAVHSIALNVVCAS